MLARQPPPLKVKLTYSRDETDLRAHMKKKSMLILDINTPKIVTKTRPAKHAKLNDFFVKSSSRGTTKFELSSLGQG